MTESQFTVRLKRDLAAATGGLVLKHADRFTGGIPDLSVTVRGVTTWIEVKVDGNVATPLQLWTMRQLGRALLLSWHGTIRGGCGELSWRGDTIFSDVFPYTELVKRIASICSNKDAHEQ